MKEIVIIVIGMMFFIACDEVRDKDKEAVSADSRELTIYCENALVPVLMELKDKFESERECTIKLHNDGSQNLSSLIQYTQKGDIYLPASRVGFRKLNNERCHYIVDSVFIGYNSLVVMSLKGNPTGYNGDINTLVLKKHAIIMANPETSSLGFDTRVYLEKEQLYDDILINVVALSTDSRGLVKSLRNEEAQLILNWESDMYVNENRNHVEVFKIPDFQQSPSEIYAGILSTSDDPELAKEFLEYACGDEAVAIFRKYGFSRRKTLIF